MHWTHVIEGVIGGLIVGVPSLVLAWLLMKRQQRFQLKLQERQEKFQRQLEDQRDMTHIMDRIGVIGLGGGQQNSPSDAPNDATPKA